MPDEKHEAGILDWPEGQKLSFLVLWKISIGLPIVKKWFAQRVRPIFNQILLNPEVFVNEIL